MRRLMLLAAGILMLAPAAQELSAQSGDPFVGTWVLSRGKSDWTPYQYFFGRTMIMEAAEGGYKVILKTVSDRRQTIESTFTARLDGKDADIDNSVLDTMSLKRVDATTIEQVGKSKGQTIETSTMKVSRDGKVLTMTTKGSRDGEEYSSVQIFNKK